MISTFKTLRFVCRKSYLQQAKSGIVVIKFKQASQKPETSIKT